MNSNWKLILFFLLFFLLQSFFGYALSESVYQLNKSSSYKKPVTKSLKVVRKLTPEEKSVLIAMTTDIDKILGLRNEIKKSDYLIRRKTKKDDQITQNLVNYLNSSASTQALVNLRQLADDAIYCTDDPAGCGDTKRCSNFPSRIDRTEKYLELLKNDYQRNFSEIKQTHYQYLKATKMTSSRRNDYETSIAFQNFDQKSNQLYNLLSSVMKAFNEMKMGTARNIL